ncbi:hypothetical protein EON65_08150 [archaeon]|nr:MAG: hypothetical protein EON65_08150 [archaeon]
MISLEDSFYLENVSFYTNSASPTYNRKLCERIIKLCLPVKMQICFSHRLQRLLFTLMKTMNADLQLKADVMIHLVNFLEEMDTNSDLWMCCCESGFAISFLQHLLPVVEEENQFAIGTFIKQKINELYVGIIQHENKYDMKAKFLLLQELLYMVAISNDFEWSLHAYEIVLAAKGVLR